MYLGANIQAGGKERLLRELDRLESLGVKNLRIQVGTEGPASEPWRIQPALQMKPGKLDRQLLKGLDFLLVEMQKRNMTAVLTLNNFFQWSGGMAQYVSWTTDTSIPYPHDEEHSWDDFQKYSATFFENEAAQELFRKVIKKIVRRRNTISKLKYKDDPTIMAWQLANEPRGFGVGQAYIDWVHETATFLKKLDENHLVSLGGEGKTASQHAGTEFRKVSASPHLDYLTAHLWIENWSWYNPGKPATFDSAMTRAKAYIQEHVAIADSLNKPIVFEEFGVSRNGLNHSAEASVDYRDSFFTFMFEELLRHCELKTSFTGLNFWSWGGEARPPEPAGFWKKGDPLIGDPPHESQGWYSVYDQDKSTLQLIRQFAEKLNTAPEIHRN